MFVKFSCGCIDLNIQNEDGNHLLLEPCDINGEDCWEPLGFGWRDMGDKGQEPLSPEKTTEMVVELNRLVMDGYKFSRVRSLLR